ncbi:unnamed protein product [Vitrella brassicaformis CCMP3155]|uniref:Uncharacterized protein n=1 Tax=Vitrella brassicaformis (strain CCMP3155) TaxID=1169540 RepID=A0A0G4GS00_VITBC|nr:unnamed protein product [Vitrella brassicaformis CCMP3155]|eukprot:CEM33136.1 unnamed protein product [Vitrella brassicaformis CCMP3155]
MWTLEHVVFLHPPSHFTDRKPLKAIKLDDIHTIEQDQHVVSLYDRDDTLLLSLQPTNNDRDLLIGQAIEDQRSETLEEPFQETPLKQDSLLIPLRSQSDEQLKPSVFCSAQPSIHEMTEAQQDPHVTLVPSGVAAVAQVIRAAKEARKILLETYAGEAEGKAASAFSLDGPVVCSACFCMVNGQCAHIWWTHDGLVLNVVSDDSNMTHGYFVKDMSEPTLEETVVSLGIIRLAFTDPLTAESFSRIIAYLKTQQISDGQDEALQKQRRDAITSFYAGTESQRPSVTSTYRRPSVADGGKTGTPLARAAADRLRYLRCKNRKILTQVATRDHPLLSSLKYNTFSTHAQRFAALEASLIGMITISSLFFWSNCATVHIVGHQIDPYVDSGAVYLSRVCDPPTVTHLPSAATVTVSVLSFVIASAVDFVIYALFRRFVIEDEMSAAEKGMQVHLWRVMDFIGWTLWTSWNVACVGTSKTC